MIINDFEKIFEEKIIDDNYIFIFSNNDKYLNIKDNYQKEMLILELKNIGFQKAMFKTLEIKANLTIIINDDFMLIDPLGNVFYKGNDIDELYKIMFERLKFLKSITRIKTINSNKNLKLGWYFNQFDLEMNKASGKIKLKETKEINDFLNITKEFASKYYSILGEEFNPNFKRAMRCRRGMPSFRFGDKFIVSKRVIENQFIDFNDLVVVENKNNKIYYYGEDKPSIDTPIHLKLYEKYPNINFMIHSHEYIKDAPYTKNVVPCGAIEEVDEIVKTINENYKSKEILYLINLKGHGSIILSENLDNLKNIEILRRNMPDFVEGRE